MTEDIAYVLGLFVGGGTISNDSFEIYLPVRKWGIENHNNIQSISLDLATDVRHRFQNAFDVIIDYTVTNDSWRIMPIVGSNIEPIKEKLREYGLPTDGVLLNSANLETLKNSLPDFYAEYFISGICDTKGSVADSHRRFNDSAPAISIEIPGSTKNFLFVTQLCSWLHDLGAFADQILYNDPCQHAPSNPYYSGWKKGFKIRFLVKEFLQSKSFSLRAKAAHAGQLANRQDVEEQGPCEDRSIEGRVKPVCIHYDIHSDNLPESVRSRIFLHYFHICALLKCPYAPVEELRKVIRDYKRHISVLPLLEKDTNRSIINSSYEHLRSVYFPDSIVNKICLRVSYLTDSEHYRVYPKLSEAIAFLFSPTLNGNRHVGGMVSIIDSNKSMTVQVFGSGTKGEPIMLVNGLNQRAAIISSIESDFNQSLIDKIVSVNDLEIKVDNSFQL